MNSIALIITLHAEDASILAEARERACHAPHYSLQDLAKLESRLDANLDGLSIAGEAGLESLLVQLAPHSHGEIFAATTLALTHNNRAALSILAKLVRESHELEPYFLAALNWQDWPSIAPWIERLLRSPEPLFRRLALAACGAHRHDPGPALLDNLGQDQPSVVAAAARVAGELRTQDLMAALRQHHGSGDEATNFWSSWATVQLGDKDALPTMQHFAHSPGPYQADALKVLLCWQAPEMSVTWLRGLLTDVTQLRLVIQATGQLGDPVAVPWLIRQMMTPAYARVAGEAFTLITGADLADLDLELKATPDFDAGPNDDPQDPNVALDPDDDLPWPDPALINAWWSKNSDRFTHGTRYLLGQPLSEAQCWNVLRSAYQRQRAIAATLLARYRPDLPLFPVLAPAKRQTSWLARYANSSLPQ